MRNLFYTQVVIEPHPKELVGIINQLKVYFGENEFFKRLLAGILYDQRGIFY